MSRLFIAEKPSLGRAIADVLGVGERTNTHIVCQNGDIVTWCFGHLLELAKPEAYGFAGWTRESLPMIPDSWKLEPRDRVKQQLSAIEKLMKNHDSVFNGQNGQKFLYIFKVLQLYLVQICFYSSSLVPYF